MLVHPPLLGPAVWGPCAGVLSAAGHRVVLPDLRDVVDPPAGWWDRATDLVAAAGGGPGAVVAAHSGAGVLVPLVVERLGAGAAVFVDALVPADGGTTPSAGIREFVAGLPVTAGRLPPWPRWWGPEAMAEMVPDPVLRRAIGAEARGLPPAFFDQTVPTPPGWAPPRVGYLRLSPAYAEAERDAAARGWPTVTRDGQHLDLATRPEETAALIADLAA